MKINISNLAHKKIMFFVDQCDFEVSGLGLVKYDKDTQTFTVTDAFLLEQQGTGTTTELDAAAVGKLMFETRSRQLQGEHLKFWWHSHVNMSAFWSGTDLSTIKDMGRNGWCVASVFNKKGEHKSAVSWLTTSELGNSLSTNEDVKTFIGDLLTQDESAALKLELDQKVKREVYTPPVDYHNRWKAPESNYFKNWQEQEELDRSKEKKSKKEVKADYWKYGLFGYGAQIESDALKMTAAAYVAKLVKNNKEEVEELEHKLMSLEASGYFFKYDQQVYDATKEQRFNFWE